MMNRKLNNQLSYNRLYEKKINVNDLCFITKFIKNNRQINLKANKLLLNFSFKEINFNKKRVAPFLLILEILSNQRNTAMKSKKNIIYLNIKKNTFVGCKVTLRENNIYEFLDTMLLYLPQLENIDLIKQQELNKNKFNNFSFWLNQLFKFYQLKNLQQDFVQRLKVIVVFNSWLSEEKSFFFTSNNIPILFK